MCLCCSQAIIVIGDALGEEQVKKAAQTIDVEPAICRQRVDEKSKGPLGLVAAATMHAMTLVSTTKMSSDIDSSRNEGTRDTIPALVTLPSI